MIVRPERPDDREQVEAVVRDAFGSPVEAKLVEDLRGSPGYLPELALVADDGEVVGHVMFTRAGLEDGTPVLLLSPLAVRTDRQRAGVGAGLVREGLRRSRERDEQVVIVEGDPRYYSRFGFVRASSIGLERPHERVPDQAFQALELPRYAGLRGKVVYPPPFEGL